MAKAQARRTDETAQPSSQDRGPERIILGLGLVAAAALAAMIVGLLV